MLNALLAWDEHTFRLLNETWLNATLDLVMPFVTDTRNYLILFIMAAIILVVVGRLHGLRFLILATVSVVVADAIGTHVLKLFFLRSRPCAALEGVRLLVGCTNSASFPSNHAINASVLAVLVTLNMPRLWFPAMAFALLVGYSRVYVGVHYPLDVLVGGGLGTVVALVISTVMDRLWPFPSGLDSRRHIFSLNIGDN